MEIIMKKIVKKTVTIALSAAMLLSMAGCGGKRTADSNSKSGSKAVKWWVALNANTAQTVSNMGETELSKALEKKFNTSIEFIHPAQGQDAEKFNIMIAMGDLPDIIEYDWNSYSGGPEKALADGVIQELNIDEDAPNLAAYVKENKNVDRQIRTDSGKYFGYPFIRGDRSLQTSAGLIIRKDWLDDLKLPVPETIDDWTKTLTAFKKQKGAVSPLDLATWHYPFGAFLGAYGVTEGMFIGDDGKVVYGPAQPGYKEFLSKMNEWYKAGLLNADFVSLDSNIIQSDILNGYSGATAGSVGGNMGKWLAAKPNDKFDLAAAPYPVLNKGDKPEFGQLQNSVTGTYAVISRDCKNPELCKKILDYGYSEEGKMLFNFGIEGESYNMVDGYPKYTDIITNNPDGLSMSASLARYALSHTEGPFIQDKRYMEQYASLPQQKEAIQVWSNTNMEKHILPGISLLPDEANAMASKIENINTYQSEMVAKFIMGIEPIDNFDAYVAELKNRGLDEYVKMMQQSYNRFLKR